MLGFAHISAMGSIVQLPLLVYNRMQLIVDGVPSAVHTCGGITEM